MAASSSQARNLRNVYYAHAPKVLLRDGATIDMTGEAFHAIKGAQVVIEKIKSRRAVEKLLLGQNGLGDVGCEELFRFLCSEQGRRYKLAEISINSNGIGDRGLEVISEYLTGNQYIRELKLQNNALQGDPEVVYGFASAVNSSRLRSLSIESNHQLSDAFLSIFLSVLDSPYLSELHISSIGLTATSVPTLVSYFASPRCRALEKLVCNLNRFGRYCTRTIIRALHDSNFTLTDISVLSADNRTTTHFSFVDDPENSDEDSLNFLQYMALIRDETQIITERNKLLKRRTSEEAIALLVYARALLLHSIAHQYPDPIARWTNFAPLPPPPMTNYHSDLPSGPLFPFAALPLELQHHILSFLAPHLSRAQRISVFKFASSVDTLPPLHSKPRTQSGCIPDPTTLLPFAPTSSKSNYCSSGKCMGAGGSVFCHRYDERNRWLEQVGCNRFELDNRTPKDVQELLQYKA